jgi:2-iminobutanoate/2-iminopropanoate deaminase
VVGSSRSRKRGRHQRRRLNTYVTDIDDYFANARPAIFERLRTAGTRFTATLLQVSRLALPQLLIEIEATAAA